MHESMDKKSQAMSLKERRKRLQLGMEGMAFMLGVPKSAYGAMEGGERACGGERLRRVRILNTGVLDRAISYLSLLPPDGECRELVLLLYRMAGRMLEMPDGPAGEFAGKLRRKALALALDDEGAGVGGKTRELEAPSAAKN